MFCVPMEWSDGVHGGHLTNFTLHRDNIVRGFAATGQRSKPSKVAYDFINNLQGVSYKVNPFTRMVAKLLAGQGISVGKFIPFSFYQEQGKDNPWTKRKTVRTEATLRIAKEFSEREFYLPWSFDFRGRVYPLVSYLSPQGTDFDKGLLMLGKGKPLSDAGLEWLQIHIATCYGKDGLDKKSLQVRKEWTKANADLLASIAADPIGTVDVWGTAEEPWSFLAGCKEFVDVVVEGKDSHLMVAADATCSGIQVLAGLSLDRQAATLVNVVPSPELQDAYMAVAEVAKAALIADGEADLATLITRKVCKPVVMTVPYNAAVQTNYGQVYTELRKAKHKVTRDQANTIGKAIVAAMGHKGCVPGAIALRDKFNSAVQVLFNSSDAPEVMRWKTPSDWEVVQECVQQRTIELTGTLMGRQKLSVAIGPETDEDGNLVVRANGHKTSFMPNLIHSLDASLLALTFHNVDHDFSVIHDCVLTHANDMAGTIVALKESYSKVFEGRNFLRKLQEEVLHCGDLVEEAPTFEASEVMESEFFFS